MKIEFCIKSHGFKPDPQNEQMTVTRYVRPFDEIGFAVMYERETGFMYGVQFQGADELAEYMTGGFILSPIRSTGFFADAVRYRPRIELLSALNLCRVDNAKQFDAAFDLAEHIVECSVLNIEHPFKIGDRVLIETNGKSEPATVTRFNRDGLHVDVVTEKFRGSVLPAQLNIQPITKPNDRT